ncbi:MAG: acyl carrier protein [Propionibacteriaceae bacterium]|jgi:acyl carrier protein|nr:acyl carrier protein [Propionibacteriaceae bacterium]
MLEDIVEVIKEYKNDSTLTITPETTFASLDLDSLESVELVMKIEEKLGVSIDMNGEITCVNDVLTVLETAN